MMTADPLADVSRETIDALKDYAGELEKWTTRINLVAPNTIPDLWDRHIRDSAQVWRIRSEAAQRWCDLGSGGGLPGLVLAILAKGQQSEMAFTFIESDKRKSAFLRTVIRSHDLNAKVLAARIEEAPAQMADIVSARALAPLPRLLDLVERHLAPNGRALLMKGENAAQEIEAAQANWHFDCKAHASVTNNRASILQVGAITRVS